MVKRPFVFWIFSLLFLLFFLAPAAGAEEETRVFFGRLHVHSSLTEGELTPAELYAQAREEGLDYLAVTDHSSAFDGGAFASPEEDARAYSLLWAAGKDAAQAASDEGFVGIYGYEMNFYQDRLLGHVGTYASSGFAVRDRSGTLESYYDALAAAGAIGQFCHPGSRFGDFQDFGQITARRDAAMCLLEVGSGPDAYFYYIRALDRGWHVAPTSREGYTAILGPELTEEGIYDALRSRRAYATGDSDLALAFTLNGHAMGSILERRQVGETVTLRLRYADPSDRGGATVEVITQGGAVAASCAWEAAGGEVTFQLPADRAYYFVTVTQADGQQAVTAPIWIDQTEEAGIAAFTGPEVPLAGRETDLALTLFNSESDSLWIKTIEIALDGQILHTAATDLWIDSGDTAVYPLTVTAPGPGNGALEATITASLGGADREYRETLELTFRPAELVRGILVDGAHGNAGLDSLSEFTSLAAEGGRQVILVEQWNRALLEQADLLVVTAPTRAFSAEFLEMAAEFVSWGGSLVVCGQSDIPDGLTHSSAQLNRLLSRVGSTIRLHDNEARDSVNNFGLETDLCLKRYNTASHLYQPQWADRIWRQTGGCTLEGGQWLVRGYDTLTPRDADGDGGTGGSVITAWERGSGGGEILVSGGLFLADDLLRRPESLWQAAYSNRSLVLALLEAGAEPLTLTPIGQVRKGTPGKAYRIRGWITARFPDAVYVQEDSGGIALVSWQGETPLGALAEVTGVLTGDGTLDVLEMTLSPEESHDPKPVTGAFSLVMDNALYGGRLVRVEGQVAEVNAKEGKIQDFLLRGADGSYATVTIGGSLDSGSLAREIRLGREVRAVGILYLRGDGIAALRVRDCEEVTLLADWPYADTPTADPTNPPTGDTILTPVLAMLLSLTAMPVLRKRRRE